MAEPSLEELIRKKYSAYAPVFSRTRRLAMRVAEGLNQVIESRVIGRVLSVLQTESKVLGGYDAMAGSYNEYYRDLAKEDSQDLVVFEGEYRQASRLETCRRFHGALVDTLDGLELSGTSLLEVGAGELSTLVPILKNSKTRFSEVSAMDVSWSRIAEGRRFASESGVAIQNFFVGSAVHLPFRDRTFDTVITCHCVEQIPMHTEQVLSELLRVARKFLVLFEPAYEFGDERQRRLIRERPYSRDIAKKLARLGANVIETRLIPFSLAPFNPTAAFVVKIEGGQTQASTGVLQCPACQKPLYRIDNFHRCDGCGVLYPELDGIPILRRENAVLATHYNRYRTHP
jgi:SAM-dependent methyltransferase